MHNEFSWITFVVHLLPLNRRLENLGLESFFYSLYAYLFIPAHTHTLIFSLIICCHFFLLFHANNCLPSCLHIVCRLPISHPVLYPLRNNSLRLIHYWGWFLFYYFFPWLGLGHYFCVELNELPLHLDLWCCFSKWTK